MADEQTGKREGLSLGTLVIAAIASGTAAVVVSHFWRSGTVIAAAMTPVLVTILKELLARPMESDVVRRSASKVSQVAVAPLRATSRTASGGYPTQTEPPPAERNGDGNGNGRADVVMAGPRRTYSAGDEKGGGLWQRLRALRGRRLKIAVVTGLLAFVVAVAAVTLPELIFGGSPSGDRTTFFGGSSSSSQDEGDRDRDGSGDQDERQTDPSQPQDSSEPAPEETEPAPQEEAPAPEETEPAPSSGGQPAPPEEGGGTPAPPVPAPQVPTP
jgi:hypothetical protein